MFVEENSPGMESPCTQATYHKMSGLGTRLGMEEPCAKLALFPGSFAPECEMGTRLVPSQSRSQAPLLQNAKWERG